MSNVQNQLKQWTTSYKKVALTPAILDKLGEFTATAIKNDRQVDAYTFTYDVEGIEVAGFVVMPKEITKPLPVIIFNRGGTGDYGLMPNGRLFTRIAEMARWGYIVCGSQYPGNSLSAGTDERGGRTDLASVLELINLAGALDVAEKSALGMYGDSRGGMMTYLSLKETDKIRAAVTVGGLANLRRSLSLRPEMAGIYEKSFGNTASGIRNRSAVEWADEMNATPLCLIHGGKDDKVSPLDALELAEKLHANNHPFELHVISGANHGLTGAFSADRDRIARTWFDKHLKGASYGK